MKTNYLLNVDVQLHICGKETRNFIILDYLFCHFFQVLLDLKKGKRI